MFSEASVCDRIHTVCLLAFFCTGSVAEKACDATDLNYCIFDLKERDIHDKYVSITVVAPLMLLLLLLCVCLYDPKNCIIAR